MEKTLRANLFWFKDDEWARIEPHLPKGLPGPQRKDDRLILSGIMHVLKHGGRWLDCPPEYGPSKTIYNRFKRWSDRGLWEKLFQVIVGAESPPEQVSLDSTFVKVHRCAHGGKRGLRPRPLALQRADTTRKSMHLLTIVAARMS